MSNVKDILIKPISAKDASVIVKRLHYSGKVVNNSSLHLGAFLNGKCEGVMSFGSPLDKRKVLPLVSGTLWNEMLELNRMAFSEKLPRNSESRALSVAFRLIKKNYPHIKWILSFSDGCQCGDGAIYRASGFVLTAIKTNNRLLRFKDGYLTHGINLCHRGSQLISKKYNPKKLMESQLHKNGDFEYITGHQLRYVYFLHKDELKNLTVPVLPFSAIDEKGAAMYKGVSIKRVKKATSSDQLESGGAVPTNTLQS